MFLGTVVNFSPGVMVGGTFKFHCSNIRGLGYYLEFLLMVSPFCKEPINATLIGCTNSVHDLSVDAILYSWISLYRNFVENSQIKIEIKRRGVYPVGGGEIFFSSRSCMKISPINKCVVGKVYR